MKGECIDRAIARAGGSRVATDVPAYYNSYPAPTYSDTA